MNKMIGCMQYTNNSPGGAENMYLIIHTRFFMGTINTDDVEASKPSKLSWDFQRLLASIC